VVRRPAQAWTPTIHLLLAHLRRQGLAGVPAPMGVRGDLEEVSFLPGDAGAACWPHQVGEAGVVSAARLLRSIHEAGRGWRGPPGSAWARPASPEAEVICHGDPGPWNMVWRDGRAVGMIDWDLACPGRALEDVAYALEWLAPFCSDAEAVRWRAFAGPPDRPARIATFTRAYGMEGTAGMVDAVIARQRATIDVTRDLATRGVQPQAQWVSDGLLDVQAERVRWSERHRHLFLET